MNVGHHSWPIEEHLFLKNINCYKVSYLELYYTVIIAISNRVRVSFSNFYIYCKFLFLLFYIFYILCTCKLLFSLYRKRTVPSYTSTPILIYFNCRLVKKIVFEIYVFRMVSKFSNVVVMSN